MCGQILNATYRIRSIRRRSRLVRRRSRIVTAPLDVLKESRRSRIVAAFQLKLTGHTHTSPRVNMLELLNSDSDEVASFETAVKLQAVEFAEQASTRSPAKKVKSS